MPAAHATAMPDPLPPTPQDTALDTHLDTQLDTLLDTRPGPDDPAESDPAQAADAAPPPACRNCGHPAPLAYCPACGQDTAAHPPTLWEFLHEFIGHYVALEGKLWRSLGLLLARPGVLTQRYLEGRKKSYVLPLRLYLSASFLFFIVLKLANPAVSAGSGEAMLQLGDSAVQGPLTSSQRAELNTGLGCPASGCSGWRAMVARAVEAGGQPERRAQLGARMMAAAPYLVFLLVPVYAALLKLAYRSRRRRYGEHLVFAFHLHAFGFLVLLLAQLPAPADAVLLVLPVYGVLALRRVYGGGWAGALLRGSLLSLLHGVVLLAAALTLALVTLGG